LSVHLKTRQIPKIIIITSTLYNDSPIVNNSHIIVGCGPV